MEVTESPATHVSPSEQSSVLLQLTAMCMAFIGEGASASASASSATSSRIWSGQMSSLLELGNLDDPVFWPGGRAEYLCRTCPIQTPSVRDRNGTGPMFKSRVKNDISFEASLIFALNCARWSRAFAPHMEIFVDKTVANSLPIRV
ncbi:hypothetical protein F443_09430 [Phytophthora nicotianae P1569]|uniref:Uncharacterized protein n=1 Tax=Phytophthora nicotianae P1569 TaxID=1317065 RepID=V9F4Z2_PHYNI|nr:hypothetical protein F443_09430 [Phytophthora nicotianae P1569]